VTLWLLALALFITLTPSSFAPSLANDRGDDLKDRRSEVNREMRHAHRELDQSTAKLARATRALERARAELDRARDAYRSAHQRRLAAALLDDRAQAALDEAEAQLAVTERRVLDAQHRIEEQERALRSFAVEAYQSGDTMLLSLSAVLSTDEPVDLVDRLGSVRTIVDRQAAAMSRMEAARTVLEVQQIRLEQNRDAVAMRRAEAAETLQRRQGTETAAAAARDEVRRLADVARDRKQDARKARAEDRKHLRQIRKERQRVERMLKRYYAKLRRQQARREARVAPSMSTGLMWPSHGWISSPYGMRRHPIYHYWRLHDGVDIASPCGRPVRASAGGRVVARYYSSVYGRRVVIGHGVRGGRGLATVYNHMRRFSTYVGEKVTRGEVIGFVGSSGWSTGCHNHFMVLRNGRPVNPAPWLR
jgi:murein DD-endopeptidase MepM/ murein hydrolase activator NlpD